MSTSDSTSFSILTDENSRPGTHDDDDEIDSLPSTDSHSSDEEDDDARSDSDAEREWRESLQQIELMLTIVVVPYIGKYFGRKCAYWGEFCLIGLEITGKLANRRWCRLGQVHGVEISEP